LYSVYLHLTYRGLLYDEVADPRAGRNAYLDLHRSLLVRLLQQRVVGGEARLALGLARTRRHLDPLELAGQRTLARGVGLLLLLEPLLLLLQPGGVVSLPRDAVAAVELEDPLRDVVEEVAGVRDGYDGARVLVEA